MLICATAHPAKFAPDVIQAITGDIYSDPGAAIEALHELSPTPAKHQQLINLSRLLNGNRSTQPCKVLPPDDKIITDHILKFVIQ